MVFEISLDMVPMPEGEKGKAYCKRYSSLEREQYPAADFLHRYVLQGSRWRVTDLTYRVTKYPTTTRLKKSEVGGQTNSRNLLKVLHIADRSNHEAGFRYVGGSH